MTITSGHACTRAALPHGAGDKSCRRSEGLFTVTAVEVLEQESEALHELAANLDTTFDEVIDLLLRIQGRVVVTGMGKSGHVARKVAATLASTGTPAFFVHPAEASHGDLGMVVKGDAVIAFSNSGETKELHDIVAYAAANGLPLIAVTQKPASRLGVSADYVLRLPEVPEACPIGCAPTTSTTMQMALGDALALTLLKAKDFDVEDFKSFHPGGKLGKKLRQVREIMHRGDELPLVAPETGMWDVIRVMTNKGFGAVGIVKDEHLVGFISDGDLRRHLSPDLLERRAKDIMSTKPFALSPNTLVERAMAQLTTRKITSSFVLDEDRIVGFVHMHDIL